jgi:hypothetical protein
MIRYISDDQTTFKIMPSVVKLLIIAGITIFLSILLAVKLFLTTPLPHTLIACLCLTPPLTIIARLVVRIPLISADAGGITVCALGFKRSSLSWRQIKRIALRYNSRDVYILDKVSSPWKINGGKRLPISGFLLPMPGEVVAKLLGDFAEQQGYPGLTTRLVPFYIKSEDVAASTLIHQKVLFDGLSWPWVWTRTSLKQGLLWGLVEGVPVGLLLVRYYPYPFTDNSIRTLMPFFALLLGVLASLGPSFWGRFLTYRANGNLVPAFMTSSVTIITALLILGWLLHAEGYVALSILLIPYATVWTGYGGSFARQKLHKHRTNTMLQQYQDSQSPSPRSEA